MECKSTMVQEKHYYSAIFKLLCAIAQLWRTCQSYSDLVFFRLVCPVQTGLVQVYKYSLILLLVTVQPWFSPVEVKVRFLAGCLFSPLHFPPPYCFLIGSKPIKTLITHSSDFIHFPKYIFATQPQRT